MPIVVSYDPAQAIGAMSVNAGNFQGALEAHQAALAQQRQQQEQDFRYAQLADSDNERQQRAAIAAQQANSLNEYRQGGLQNQRDLQTQRLGAQNDLDKQKAAERLDAIAAQYEAQGANQQQVQQLRNQAAAMRTDAARYGADQRLAGTQYGADQRLAGTQYGADMRYAGQTDAANTAADQRYYATDANNRTRMDVARLNAAQPHGQDPTVQIWGRQVSGLGADINSTRAEMGRLQSAISRDQFGVNPNTAAAQQRLQALQADLQQKIAAHDQLINNPPQSLRNRGAATQPADFNQPSTDSMPSVPMAPQGAQPQTQPTAADYSPGGDDLVTAARAHIAQLKAMGASREVIRAHLLEQFPDLANDGSGGTPQEP